MQTRNPAPLFVSLFAALAIVYPVLGVRTSQGNSATGAKSLKGISAPPEGGSGKQEFPNAKDIVSRFLFSQAAGPTNPAEKAGTEQYSIELLLATVPDPIDSRLPNFFDSFVESIASAAEASGYTLDRFAFPWTEAVETGQKSQPLWRQTIYDSNPGLILFRNPRQHQLLLVFVVGETPTTGIHKQALFSALDQMAQFYPWDPHHAELPPEFPTVKSLSSSGALRMMGPAFSGSAVSLRFVLESWLKSRGDSPNLRFQIISGSATAIDPSGFSQFGHDQVAFHATVPPDREVFRPLPATLSTSAILGLQFSRNATPPMARTWPTTSPKARREVANLKCSAGMQPRSRRYWTFLFRCTFRSCGKHRFKRPARHSRRDPEATAPSPPRSRSRPAIPLSLQRSCRRFRN